MDSTLRNLLGFCWDIHYCQYDGIWYDIDNPIFKLVTKIADTSNIANMEHPIGLTLGQFSFTILNFGSNLS